MTRCCSVDICGIDSQGNPEIYCGSGGNFEISLILAFRGVVRQKVPIDGHHRIRDCCVTGTVNTDAYLLKPTERVKASC